MVNILSIQDGEPFITSNGIIFRQPTIEDIKFMGESIYLTWVYTWLNEPRDVIHELWVKGIDDSKITKDELFIDFVKSNKVFFINVLAHFTNINNANIEYIDEFELECIVFTIEDSDEIKILEPTVFDEICEFLEVIHFHKHKTRRYFKSEADRKYILDYEIEEKRRSVKSNMDKRQTYMSSLKQSLVIYNARDWEYVKNLTVYQLFAEAYGINRLEESKRLYQGVYAGTVDFNKVDKKGLDWINNN